jgi:hypothetical protein
MNPQAMQAVPLAVEVVLLTKVACREAAAALLDTLDHISRGLESEPQYIFQSSTS